MMPSTPVFNAISSKILTVLFVTGLGAQAAANDVKEFKSTTGVTESCTTLEKFSFGDYSKRDLEKEGEFCSIDFNSSAVALCPKNWSTSAAVMIYKLPANISAHDYETTKCGSKEGHKTLAKFKMTVNESGTSATNSQAALLYYHFSRILHTSVKVPVAVKRTIDRQDLENRVVKRSRGLGKMNPAAWSYLNKWLTGPFNEINKPDLFESANEVHGVLYRDKGNRYETEINGVRSAWGVPQNEDFQKTAAFSALRSSLPLLDAVKDGIRKAQANPKLAADLAGSPSDYQMILWMRDLTDITLLDFIFSQQDRVGNIDYEWEWAYVQNGEVRTLEVSDKEADLPRKKMKNFIPPASIAMFKPLLVQRTWIGDNDAGGKTSYVNYTKKTNMLQNIRHYNSGLYKQLMALNLDLSSKGPIFSFVAQNFKVTPRELQMFVTNVQEASTILQANCEAGQLKFDLSPKKFLLGQSTEEVVDCKSN